MFLEFIYSNNSDQNNCLLPRFVLLPDCGHAIEHEGLKGWLQVGGDGEVQMKCCPRCQHPIYNCQRFKNIILQTHNDVQKVLNMTAKKSVEISMKTIVEKLIGMICKLILFIIQKWNMMLPILNPLMPELWSKVKNYDRMLLCYLTRVFMFQ